MGTKNNPANRGISAGKKQYDGKEVKPVRFIGGSGGGNFIAAEYDNGDMVIDRDGNPIPYANI
jgi:hypothetical protein